MVLDYLFITIEKLSRLVSIYYYFLVGNIIIYLLRLKILQNPPHKIGTGLAISRIKGKILLTSPPPNK